MRWALALAVWLGPALARADDARLEEAVAAYGALELERAHALVEAVLASAPAPAVHAHALVLRALLHYQGSDPERGRADLAAALALDPTVPLPVFAPPSVREVFEALVRARAPAAPVPPPTVPPLPRRAAAADRPAPVERHRPERSRGIRPWVWSLGGAGVAALAAGGGALWAVSTRAEIEEQPHEEAELSSLTTRFETGRTIAIAGTIVGAALLAVTALLLYLDRADRPGS